MKPSQQQPCASGHPKCRPEHKDSPKNSTIPHYSQRFKDIIAKSTLDRKLAPEPKPLLSGAELLLKPSSEPSYFFFRVKSIGVGAHSFVYLVQDEESKMLLAEKSVTKQHAAEIKNDLIREIKLLLSLEHPNLIKLYHVYPSETHINLVMEFAEDSLFSLKQKFGVFKEKEVIEVARQLLLALEYIHAKNIVHADIKLENIMISNGTIKVCDFGLAHVTHKRHEDRQDNGQKQEVVGTLQYLPPEYAKGTDSGVCRDIWAVGVLVFEMATGKHPFEGLKENEKWSKLIKSPPSSYLDELEEFEKAQGSQLPKVKELLRGIFVVQEKRWSASRLLDLAFMSAPVPSGTS